MIPVHKTLEIIAIIIDKAKVNCFNAGIFPFSAIVLMIKAQSALVKNTKMVTIPVFVKFRKTGTMKTTKITGKNIDEASIPQRLSPDLILRG